MAPKYALCRHGPLHQHRDCNFAHSLSELEFATGYWCFCQDSSASKEGKAGVDMFYGQVYPAEQLFRVMKFMCHCPLVPSWARMVLWYYQILPEAAFVWCGLQILQDILPDISTICTFLFIASHQSTWS